MTVVPTRPRCRAGERSTIMEKRRLGRRGLQVSALGLGCMGMSEFYGPRDAALDAGVTLVDMADVYGPFTNEEQVGQAIRGRREWVVLATEIGIVRDPNDPAVRGVNGRPEYVRAACEGSLKRLGMEVIDLDGADAGLDGPLRQISPDILSSPRVFRRQSRSACLRRPDPGRRPAEVPPVLEPEVRIETTMRSAVGPTVPWPVGRESFAIFAEFAKAHDGLRGGGSVSSDANPCAASL
jgi:hypothetical protein